MYDIKINKVPVEYLPQLQQISRQTFYEAFAAVNTEDNMNRYLEEGFSTAKLTGELHTKGSEFYFAKLDGEIIGYLKVNSGQAQTELKNENALEIERIYVLKAFQGKKVGQLLYEKALQIAREKNAAYIWLGVWEKNKKAINFYQKNRFAAFDKHIFKLGDDAQTDIMMKLEL